MPIKSVRECNLREEQLSIPEKKRKEKRNESEQKKKKRIKKRKKSEKAKTEITFYLFDRKVEEN